MQLPPPDPDTLFEDLLQDLPPETLAMAYEFKAFTRARKITKGLELLTTLPGTPERARQELSLHIALGATLAVTKGYDNTEAERVSSYRDTMG